MELSCLPYYLHEVFCHRYWFLPRGLPFQVIDIFAPYLMGNFYILHYNWAVPDLVALNYPLEILIRWTCKTLTQGTCFLRACNLSLRELLLVCFHYLNEGVVLAGIIVMMSALVLFELHIR